jgi:hypothetical protein
MIDAGLRPRGLLILCAFMLFCIAEEHFLFYERRDVAWLSLDRRKKNWSLAIWS